MRSWLTRTFGETAVYATARTIWRGGRALGRTVAKRRPGACRTSIAGRHNEVDCRRALVLQRVVVIVNGDNNVIEFDRATTLRRCTFTVNGNDNRIVIGASALSDSAVTLTGDGNRVAIEEACMLLHLGVVCEDSCNAITIGAGTEVHGSTELAAIEGTGISVGRGCLFSGGIHLRTGDSHTITDLNGNRINQSKSIEIAERVWVGRNVTMLKGSSVAASCVVGASAVVTKRFEEPHCIVAGNPAGVVRRGIDWKSERISNPTSAVQPQTEERT